MKYFWYLLLATILALASVACVTTGDLEEFSGIQTTAVEAIAEAQREHQRKVEELLDDTTKTDAEILEGLTQLSKEKEAVVKEIAAQTGKSVEELVQIIQERTRAVAGAAGTLTGNALMDMLLTALVGGGAAYAGVNRSRDNRRLVRGEPVAVQPLSHS